MNTEPKKKKVIVIRKVQKPSTTVKTKEKEKPIKTKDKVSKPNLPSREVKYIYPADCNDMMTRKRFRAEVRTAISKYEKLLSKEEKNSTKWKKLNTELLTYKKRVMKVDKD